MPIPVLVTDLLPIEKGLISQGGGDLADYVSLQFPLVGQGPPTCRVMPDGTAVHILSMAIIIPVGMFPSLESGVVDAQGQMQLHLAVPPALRMIVRWQDMSAEAIANLQQLITPWTAPHAGNPDPEAVA